MQSYVAIAVIKTKPVWQENMLDLIPGYDIVGNFSSLSIISVIVGRIHGKASLITFIHTLSGPEPCLTQTKTILRTSTVVSARRTNSFSIKLSKPGKYHLRNAILIREGFYSLCCASTHSREKFIKFVCYNILTSCVSRGLLRGMQFLIAFHIEL